VVEAKQKSLRHYQTANARDPFGEWMKGLRGDRIHGIILTRLDRVEQGNFGNCEPVGAGVLELKIDVGPGYRVYFGVDGEDVILLGGGTKGTQSSDMKKAKEYWREYHASTHE
jgi:putative addiction module killer protein